MFTYGQTVSLRKDVLETYFRKNIKQCIFVIKTIANPRTESNDEFKGAERCESSALCKMGFNRMHIVITYLKNALIRKSYVHK